MISLGFDASTATVGYAFIEDKKILSTGFIDISKVEGNRNKAWYVISEMVKNPLFDKVDTINLEASLAGFSGANVVVMLAKWNAVFEYVLEEHFKKPINLINVSTARKQAFGKARIKGIKPKPFVESEINKLYDMTPWIVYNKIKNIDKRCADMYDAIVIGLYSPINDNPKRSNRSSKKT